MISECDNIVGWNTVIYSICTTITYRERFSFLKPMYVIKRWFYLAQSMLFATIVCDMRPTFLSIPYIILNPTMYSLFRNINKSLIIG